MMTRFHDIKLVIHYQSRVSFKGQLNTCLLLTTWSAGPGIKAFLDGDWVALPDRFDLHAIAGMISCACEVGGSKRGLRLFTDRLFYSVL